MSGRRARISDNEQTIALIKWVLTSTFGVLRALGGRRGHLLRIFLGEGLALGGLGFLVGVPAGWAVARLLIAIISAALITLRFTVLPLDVGLSLLLALLLSTLAGLFPALAASRLRVAEVLRYD